MRDGRTDRKRDRQREGVWEDWQRSVCFYCRCFRVPAQANAEPCSNTHTYTHSHTQKNTHVITHTKRWETDKANQGLNRHPGSLEKTDNKSYINVCVCVCVFSLLVQLPCWLSGSWKGFVVICKKQKLKYFLVSGTQVKKKKHIACGGRLLSVFVSASHTLVQVREGQR